MTGIGRGALGMIQAVNCRLPMKNSDWIGNNYLAKLQVGQWVYCAIAVAAANPLQPEHCHHASFAVNTCPVTIQLNAGNEAPTASTSCC